MMIKEYVPANEIWPNAMTHFDKGYQSGFVRGYNVEVTKNGVTHWMGCEYIHGEPSEELFDEFHQFLYSNCEVIPTGRISFRGYAREEYDPEERDYFVIPVEV